MEEMIALVEKLNDASYRYYSLSEPVMSDAEYDKLYDRLLELEKETGIVLPASPSRRVGAQPLAGFEQHTHLAPLWSMDKAQSKERLDDWAMRAEKLRQQANSEGAVLPPLKFVVEHKFDGLTINLTYENGILVCAATRGNGTTGEMILPQVMTIKSIPLTVPYKGRFEVHGECLMRVSVLNKYNETAAEKLKNARNAAAGALRNLDPAVTAARKLDAYFYDVGYIEGRSFASQDEMLSFLHENRIPCADFEVKADSLEEVKAAIDRVEDMKADLDYMIDGAVIKITDYATREALGYTDRFPRWAVAYKFEAEERETTVENVTWQVGRTGKLTPLAFVSPVELAGATVRRATLNNYSDIMRKHVRVGAKVLIRRSNEVIPEILRRVEAYDDENETPVEKPEVCPACGSRLIERGAHIFCPNTDECPPQLVARLSHFASRDAMDIDTFSEKTAQQLIDAGLIKEAPDLYALKADSLVILDRFGDKKAENLLNAIDKSRKPMLDRFIYAIGIPNIGAKTAKDIAARFSSLEAIRKATKEELLEIDDVGDIVAESVVSFFESEKGNLVVDRLLANGVSPQWEDEKKGNVFEGMTVVVTGTLLSMGRREAESAITSNGGKAAGSVSKKTSLVVAGENAGSKLTKATELGIKVINEEEFIALLNQ